MITKIRRSMAMVLTVLFCVTAPTVVWASQTPKTALKKITASAPAKKVKTKINARRAVKIKKTVRKASSAVPGFSASAAAGVVSANGKTPPPGYMATINKALKVFLVERRAARGNKAKLEAAEAKYNQVLAAAQQLLSEQQ